MDYQRKISDIKDSLVERLGYHSSESKRLEQMIKNLETFIIECNKPIGRKGRGRPEDMVARDKLMVAINSLPERFSRKEAEDLAKGLTDFGRLFREAWQ